jgi:hypothetical protein
VCHLPEVVVHEGRRPLYFGRILRGSLALAPQDDDAARHVFIDVASLFALPNAESCSIEGRQPVAADWWSGCGSCGRGSSPSLRAVRASSPPALRPGRGVLRLSAIGGAGNACTLPLARSAAWAELERSVAPASAAVERRKASGPDVGPLPRPTRIQVATSDCAARTWLDAPFGAPPPSAFVRDGEISLLRGGEQSSGADAPRERLFFHPPLMGRVALRVMYPPRPYRALPQDLHEDVL